MKTKENTKIQKNKKSKKIYIPPAIVENDITIADAALPTPGPAPAPLAPIPAPRTPAPARPQPRKSQCRCPQAGAGWSRPSARARR